MADRGGAQGVDARVQREPGAAVDRPDIVLVLTDQQRWDWTGRTSGGFFETPCLDALAAGGLAFDGAWSSATTCVPARTSLLTGLHHYRVPRVPGPSTTAQIGDPLAMSEGVWTIARALRGAGYETALMGRMHFEPIDADHGFETVRSCENISPGSGYGSDDIDDYARWMAAQGLPDWRLFHPGPGGPVPHLADVPRAFPADADHHPTGWIEHETIEFLRTRRRDRPLFLVVSFPHPHAPYDPPEPYASLYDPADADPPADGFEVNATLLTSFHRAWSAASSFHAPTVRSDDAAGDATYRALITAVRGLVRHIDDALDHITAELDLPRTALFFTSDHGDYGGHRGLFQKTPYIPFEDLLRVPLIVAGGAVQARPGVVDDCVQTGSFTATCLDLAGVAPPDDDGDFPSLLGFLQGQADPTWSSRPIYASLLQNYPTVRIGHHKVIQSWTYPETLLFDLEADPGETRSLDGDPAQAELLAHATELFTQQLSKPSPARNPPPAWAAGRP